MPGAGLARALLADATSKSQSARALWEGRGGAARVLVKKDGRGGATVQLVGAMELDRSERRMLARTFATLLEEMAKAGPMDRAETSQRT